MDLLCLSYFQTIAKLQHMTKASVHLNVSQPALSKTLRRLEEELGVKLFDRMGKNLSLNEDGRILLKYTEIVFRALGNARMEIQDRREAADNTVNISLRLVHSCWMNLVVLFKKQYPEINLFFKYHYTQFATDIPADLIFYATAYDVRGDNVVRLGSERLALLLPNEHPLARRAEVSLREVRDEAFICSSDDELRRTTKEMCRIAGFVPCVTMEADIDSNIQDYVKHGLGVAVVPAFTWMCRPDPGLSLVTIRDVIRHRHVYLAWQENIYLSRAARTFRDYTIDFFGKLGLEKE